ncbi:hypothetical protein HDU87_003980 [Geranomyces variabilis]|uniref:Uncharacterized protein n=1 Tax=Geranomyces variabilis TaxID=109894 RepID=A0AAD5TQY7_9FUNG|nr:hypothetical protein HDU87_003980 [Geranomyces variabilis]
MTPATVATAVAPPTAPPIIAAVGTPEAFAAPAPPVDVAVGVGKGFELGEASDVCVLLVLVVAPRKLLVASVLTRVAAVSLVIGREGVASDEVVKLAATEELDDCKKDADTASVEELDVVDADVMGAAGSGLLDAVESADVDELVGSADVDVPDVVESANDVSMLDAAASDALEADVLGDAAVIVLDTAESEVEGVRSSDVDVLESAVGVAERDDSVSDMLDVAESSAVDVLVVSADAAADVLELTVCVAELDDSISDALAVADSSAVDVLESAIGVAELDDSKSDVLAVAESSAVLVLAGSADVDVLGAEDPAAVNTSICWSRQSASLYWTILNVNVLGNAGSVDVAVLDESTLLDISDSVAVAVSVGSLDISVLEVVKSAVEVAVLEDAESEELDVTKSADHELADSISDDVVGSADADELDAVASTDELAIGSNVLDARESVDSALDVVGSAVLFGIRSTVVDVDSAVAVSVVDGVSTVLEMLGEAESAIDDAKSADDVDVDVSDGDIVELNDELDVATSADDVVVSGVESADDKVVLATSEGSADDISAVLDVVESVYDDKGVLDVDGSADDVVEVLHVIVESAVVSNALPVAVSADDVGCSADDDESTEDADDVPEVVGSADGVCGALDVVTSLDADDVLEVNPMLADVEDVDVLKNADVKEVAEDDEDETTVEETAVEDVLEVVVVIAADTVRDVVDTRDRDVEVLEDALEDVVVTGANVELVVAAELEEEDDEATACELEDVLDAGEDDADEATATLLGVVLEARVLLEVVITGAFPLQ